MHVFLNIFLVGFALDALLHVASSQLSGVPGFAWLAGLANALTGLLVLYSLPVFILMGMRPRLRWRIFLPPCLFLSWVVLGAMPLPIWFDAAEAELAAGSVEAAFAAMAFAFCHQQNAGDGWLLEEASSQGPSFSRRTALAFTALNLVVILPASLAYLAISGAAGVGHLSQGFVSIRADGIHLSHREYVRGEQTIHLVAMMHIGEAAFYEELTDALPVEGTIFLTEGVNDEAGVLPRSLGYSNVAGGLGLVVQPEFGASDLGEWPSEAEAGPIGAETRNADVDASEFSRETLEFLASAARIWSAETPAQALLRYAELIDGMDPETSRRLTATLSHDLIELRNEHLLVELEQSLLDYETVVVPWGALHLPGILERVRELGFVEQDTTARRVVSW